jgi:hypothetical protein
MRTAIISILIVVLGVSSGLAQICDPPGEFVGTTQYPVQSSGAAVNRIAVDALDGVHFTWMHGTSIFDRNVYYNYRDSEGDWIGQILVNEVNGAGYPTLALTSSGAAAVAYHNTSNGYAILALDAVPGFGIFDYFDPPDLAPSGNHAFWPQVAVSTNGDLHILMVEHTQDAGVYPSMMYTRSEDGGESWTSPEEVAEVALLNGCITASPDGKVAIVYLLPIRGGEFSQVKNDVAYFVSEDGREWDFSDPIRVTEYSRDDLDIYCPWGIDAVYDDEGNLDITWVTGHIDDEGIFIDETAQLWHYSEATGTISQVAESTDDQLTCLYGAVTLPISMPSISVGHEDYHPVTIVYVGYDETDASAEGDCVGDLYMVVGYFNGEEWIGPYNLTETHSPGCAPGECESENFASTAEMTDDRVYSTYVKQKLGDIPDTVYYMPIDILIPDAVDDNSQLPGSFALHGNYPNPFNAQTVIEFELSEDTDIGLEVYDITGALVETLYRGRLESGLHSLSWNADSYASGVYYYLLSDGSASRAGKMVLLK